MRLRRIFGRLSARRAAIYGAVALRQDEFVPEFDYRFYMARPERACGKAVVNNSWVVFVELPDAPMASLYPALVYVARTPTGWRPWYVGFPNAKGWGFVNP
jgi:hypothetical protein